MHAQHALDTGGSLATRVLRAVPDEHPLVVWPHVTDDRMRLDDRVVREHSQPDAKLADVVNAWRHANRRHLARGMRRVHTARLLGIPTHFGALFCTKITKHGDVIPYGLASLRVVTDAGVAFIVDAFQNSTELENLKYHGMGTGSTAEAAGQTALVTELTTEYNPNSTRATGTTIEGATANIYRTVGTNTIDSGTPAIVEHGIFSQAATGGGTMLDRSVFSAINLAASDGIQFTYDLTFTSGG